MASHARLSDSDFGGPAGAANEPPPGSTHALRVGRAYVLATVLTAALLCARVWNSTDRSNAFPGAWASVVATNSSNAGAALSQSTELLWNVTISELSSETSLRGALESPAPAPSFHNLTMLVGTHELLSLQSASDSDSPVEVVWQQSSGRNLTGVLLLAHGCSHSATDWWPPSDSCPRCIGLPEEKRIVTAALDSGLFVIAVSSVDRDSRCWHVQFDAPRVLDALDTVLSRLNISRDVPRFAMGASSGGAFAALLPVYTRAPHPPWRAVCSQIMGVPPEMLTKPDASDGNNGTSTPAIYPPSLWVHMPRDPRLAGLVAADVATLRAANATVEELQVHPLPVTPEFLRSRIPGMDDSVAASVHSAFAEAGLLDSDGFLRNDPRSSSWRDVLAEASVLGDDGTLPSGDALQPDESALAEVLNLAYAVHEMVGTPNVTQHMLDFFLAQRSGLWHYLMKALRQSCPAAAMEYFEPAAGYLPFSDEGPEEGVAGDACDKSDPSSDALCSEDGVPSVGGDKGDCMKDMRMPLAPVPLLPRQTPPEQADGALSLPLTFPEPLALARARRQRQTPLRGPSVSEAAPSDYVGLCVARTDDNGCAVDYGLLIGTGVHEDGSLYWSVQWGFTPFVQKLEWPALRGTIECFQMRMESPATAVEAAAARDALAALIAHHGRAPAAAGAPAPSRGSKRRRNAHVA